MAPYYGEAQVLFLVFGLNLLSIFFNGWICGKIFSYLCIRGFYPHMTITLTLLVIATVFTLIAGILQILCMVKRTERYLLISRILTICAAIFAIASIFYLYDNVLNGIWSQRISLLIAGMVLGISIYQLSNIFYVRLENRKTA
ncbi:unnamed protein product [Rodentolepis nana]|uniref:Polysaccharide biosynthesis protein n=1 Tax=Rodentolepis nana TaxID=102285 RepID=A0A0R3TAK4_RODNA|nr:unnamed protein product [Rodentolepis nana]